MWGILDVPTFVVKILIKKGLIYLLYFIPSYIYLTIYRLLRKQRLDVYDYTASGEPYKQGLLVPSIERELESPRTTQSIKQFSDDVFIFGTNSNANYFAIHIARLPENYVRCSLFMQLENGNIYSLPQEHTVQKAVSEENTFGSSRIKLQCIGPMRKWRVFFNGILKESTGKEDENTPDAVYKHVKLTFLWTASSEIFDFSCDMSTTQLSHAVASSASWTSFPIFLLKKLHSIFDRYEQPGSLLGTVQIENDEEQEIYLWGSRIRSLGRISNLEHSNYTDICANFEDGSLIHISTLDIPGIIKGFKTGFLMRSNGFVFPIDECEYEKMDSSRNNFKILCSAGEKTYHFRVNSTVTNGVKFLKEFAGSTSVKATDCVMNNVHGKGMIFKGIVTEKERLGLKKNKILNFPQSKSKDDSYFCPFNNLQCQSIKICGGKGSSLGKLFMMTTLQNKLNLKNQFAVPKGLVVTTFAYDVIIKAKFDDELKQFETNLCRCNTDEDIKHLCERIRTIINAVNFPNNLKDILATRLKEVFGESYMNTKFAIRSSAVGEDTEQMSAAGQMETFLGVKEIDNITTAIIKCWASQFTFQAVKYKKTYGQQVHMPMAVVIQEMIPSDVAGVIFTCDPVSGNPSYITITANWGLGESVVSASAEPDTIVLERDMANRLKINKVTLGKKTSKIVMDETGTKETEVTENDMAVCCLTEDQTLKLGHIALEIESEYGSPRDIEWGISNGEVFLFQSRPITSIDVDTDFETEHFADTPLRCEKEIMTRAHVGEALPGAVSILGSSTMQSMGLIANAKQFIKFDADNLPQKPYALRGFVLAYYTIFFNLISGLFNFEKEENDFTKALIVAFFGRLIDTSEIRKMASKRHETSKKFSIKDFIKPFYIVYMSLFSGVMYRRAKRSMKSFKIPYQKSKSANETLQIIFKYYGKDCQVMCAHTKTSFSSSVWNSILLTMLAKAEGEWDNKVYSDFAYLMSSITEVESANVPASMQELACIISKNSDPVAFRKMTVTEAVEFLNRDKGEIGFYYKKFLKRHGHRCIKEFDVYSKVWEMDPHSLIETLQNTVSENSKVFAQKKIKSFSEILSNLNVEFNFLERLKLRFVLFNAQRGVRDRESSKAAFVKHIHNFRKSYYHLANQMVCEGRLQKQEHMFFLTIHELEELTKVRSPRTVARAVKRYKCFDKMNKLIFEEITSGFPKPINQSESIPTAKGFCMTGVPVSRGVIMAKARVVKSISEASTIEQGEILITYSTDIAWSPYFPLLSGVVTELGGLISHGVVVAREYGLPCVVSLHGATRAFKSGEMVLLDGNKGTLQKID